MTNVRVGESWASSRDPRSKSTLKVRPLLPFTPETDDNNYALGTSTLKLQISIMAVLEFKHVEIKSLSVDRSRDQDKRE
jgi:hypothetical protein